MPYSKPRYSSRKYLPPENNFIKIPFPNELETPNSPLHKGPNLLNGLPGVSSIIDFFKSRITIEEIILVGLIILLLGEEIKDEFLIIMLIYILLF